MAKAYDLKNLQKFLSEIYRTKQMIAAIDTDK